MVELEKDASLICGYAEDVLGRRVGQEQFIARKVVQPTYLPPTFGTCDQLERGTYSYETRLPKLGEVELLELLLELAQQRWRVKGRLGGAEWPGIAAQNECAEVDYLRVSARMTMDEATCIHLPELSSRSTRSLCSWNTVLRS